MISLPVLREIHNFLFKNIFLDEQPPYLPRPSMQYNGVALGGKIGNGHQSITFQNGMPMLKRAGQNENNFLSRSSFDNNVNYYGDYSAEVTTDFPKYGGAWKDPEPDEDEEETTTDSEKQAGLIKDDEDDDEDEDEEDETEHPMGGQNMASLRPDLEPSTKSIYSNTPPSASQIHTGPVDMVMGIFGLAKNYCLANGGKCRLMVTGCRRGEHYLEQSCSSVWGVCCGKPMSRKLRSKEVLVLQKILLNFFLF